MAMVWIRSLPGSKELVFASDSRLRDAGYFDCGPKIMPLSRGDSAICFSGNTAYAYPIMNHIVAMSSMHLNIKSKAICLSDLKANIYDIFNNMTSVIGDLPVGEKKNIDTNFIFGGYCWRSEEFKMWRFKFDIAKKKFELKLAKPWNDKKDGKQKLLFIGDYQAEAMKRLKNKMKAKGKNDNSGFDYEPFEVLRDMLRENSKYPYIGGAPQLVKIYKNMNCIAYPVYWPDKNENKLVFMGRPLLNYEKHNYLNFDPDLLTLEKPE